MLNLLLLKRIEGEVRKKLFKNHLELGDVKIEVRIIPKPQHKFIYECENCGSQFRRNTLIEPKPKMEKIYQDGQFIGWSYGQ